MLEGAVSELERIFALDPRELSVDAVCGRFNEVTRLIRRLEGWRLRDLERVDRSGEPAATHGSTAAWIRSTDPSQETLASRLVGLARDLQDVFPQTAAALMRGDITIGHAETIAGLRHDCDDDSLRAADQGLAEAAATMTVKEFRDAVTALRHSLQPETVADDEDRLFDRRELTAASTFNRAGIGRWFLDNGPSNLDNAVHR